MKIENKVTILGCGHGGMALAADLKLKGANVALWSDPNHASKFNKILDKNGQIILHDANITNTIKIDLFSHNLSEVLNYSDIIYNCTPMSAHAFLFERVALTLYKTNKIKLFINVSGAFSGIEQYIKTSNKTIFDKIKLFDTSTFPYACRVNNSNNVSILGRKSEISIAPLFPSHAYYLDFLMKSMQPTSLNIVDNTFKLGLMATNAVFHPATVLLNARLIDHGCSFYFYKEGVSEKTSQLHEALDNERILLAKKMGYQLNKNVEDINKFYGTSFTDNYDYCTNSRVHENITSPLTLEHRYITEDVAFGLVPLLTLSKLYNIKLPNIESVINIFSTIMGVDYCKSGRNLKTLTKDFIQKISYSICEEQIPA